MGPLTRYMRYATQDEPVLSAGLLAALGLLLLDRWMGLTEDDLELLGLLLVPVAGALLARLRAWSPSSARRAISDAYEDGLTGQVQPPADPGAREVPRG